MFRHLSTYLVYNVVHNVFPREEHKRHIQGVNNEARSYKKVEFYMKGGEFLCEYCVYLVIF